ncbi:hypothetical protein V1527DRAFT_476999 [Lipomyces starkeyi]
MEDIFRKKERDRETAIPVYVQTFGTAMYIGALGFYLGGLVIYHRAHKTGTYLNRGGATRYLESRRIEIRCLKRCQKIYARLS